MSESRLIGLSVRRRDTSPKFQEFGQTDSDLKGNDGHNDHAPGGQGLTLTDELRKSLHDNVPSIFGEPIDT
jgi:hypothetical protein